MKKIKILFLFTLLLISYTTSAQDANFEKIANSLEKYFELEREKIHIHLNKTTYITNEAVWFKGYVFDRKNAIPFVTTTNVFCEFFDSDGNKLLEKLIYASNGSFESNIEIDPDLKTGIYYLRFFTNWMNNFQEDESSTYAIQIINSDEKYYEKTTTLDYNSLEININPESGSLLTDIFNSVAVRIYDKNKNGFELSNVIVKDEKNQKITSFSTNKLGYGRFDFIPKDGKTYYIEIKNEKINKTHPLPAINQIGFNYTVNSFYYPNKTIVQFKTNSKSIKSLQDKSYYIVIHQDNKAIVEKINFNNKNLEKKYTFLNKDLFQGINTMRLLDENLNEISHRTFYLDSGKKVALKLNDYKKQNDSIKVNINTFNSLNNLSVSVLPSKTMAYKSEKNIFSAFNIDSYLQEDLHKPNYYFKNFDKKKHFELDIALLCQEEIKYTWFNILNHPPKGIFEFDKGLSIKGTINHNQKNDNGLKVKIYSFSKSLNELTYIDDKNSFYFNNLYVTDSTNLNFQLMKNDELVTSKIMTSVTNLKRTFNKPLILPVKSFDSIESKEVVNDFEYEIPKVSKNIVLKEVQVSGNTKSKKLSYANEFGNNLANGYKITDYDFKVFRNVLEFIQAHGFDAGFSAGRVFVRNRRPTTFGGASQPVIMVDGTQIFDFDMLYNLDLLFIDEIYINKDDSSLGARGNSGSIKIYTKKSDFVDIKNKSNSLTIANGFSKQELYEEPLYGNLSSPGYINYGVVHWIPNYFSGNSNSIELSFPQQKQKEYLLFVEGVTFDGKFISEEIIIDTNSPATK
jgi:hypothetical protein